MIIAMQGNPFSPDYFRARRRGRGRALDFCSMQAALYGPNERLGRSVSAWAFEERPIRERDRTASELAIGTSAIRWEGDRVVVDLDERTTPPPPYNPFRRPLKGRVVVHPEAQPAMVLGIDDAGRHRWWPVAPLARIEVELEEPRLRFSGHGYFDANAGDASLDADFESWSWSRARVHGKACLTYDVACASGAQRTHAFTVSASNEVEPIEPTWRAPLAPSFWRFDRHARVDQGADARVVRSLEDGPFYTRALVDTRLAGTRTLAVHETLVAHRLRRRWVRFCTSYRMRSEA